MKRLYQKSLAEFEAAINNQKIILEYANGYADIVLMTENKKFILKSHQNTDAIDIYEEYNY